MRIQPILFGNGFTIRIKNIDYFDEKWNMPGNDFPYMGKFFST